MYKGLLDRKPLRTTNKIKYFVNTLISNSHVSMFLSDSLRSRDRIWVSRSQETEVFHCGEGFHVNGSWIFCLELKCVRHALMVGVLNRGKRSLGAVAHVRICVTDACFPFLSGHIVVASVMSSFEPALRDLRLFHMTSLLGRKQRHPQGIVHRCRALRRHDYAPRDR